IQGKLSPTNKTHQGSGGDTSYQAKRWRIHGGLYGKIQSRNPGCGRSAGMHEDLWIHARYNPPRADQAFIRENSEWKQPEGGNKPNFKKGFKNKQRSDRKPDRFSLLTKTPKEIFALEKGKFKAPPPMVTPSEKRDPNKYCEFHAITGHSTDECMQVRKQIDEMIKSGEGSQTKAHPEFLSRDNNLFSIFRRGRQNGRTNNHRSLNRRALRTPDIRRRRSVIRSSIRTLLCQALAINKKPDDPNYHITHRIQWRNHLADRPDIPTSKDRCLRAFHFRMDELHGYQVTISTQWNNRQNGYKKDLCHTIHGTRNVKIPDKRKNGNDMKQQSHPDGMCNDLRT
ncbi:hypothetical protein Tco_0958400, partial [Tanacetum coccineum]